MEELRRLEADRNYREIVALCERTFDQVRRDSERVLVLGELARSLVEIEPRMTENDARARKHIEHALELDKRDPSGIRPAIVRMRHILRARLAEVSRSGAAGAELVKLLEDYDPRLQTVERARAAHNLMTSIFFLAYV